jgi:hypothetical protein
MHVPTYYCLAEYKQSLKRERDNARYDKNKDVILQRLRETRRQKKCTDVLNNGQHTQPDTLMSIVFPTEVILATNESSVNQIPHLATPEGFVSDLTIQSYGYGA